MGAGDFIACCETRGQSKMFHRRGSSHGFLARATSFSLRITPSREGARDERRYRQGCRGREGCRFSPRAEPEKDAKKKRKSSSRGKGGGGDPPAPPPTDEPGADDGDGGDLIDRMTAEFALVLVGSKVIIMREQPAAPAHDRLRMLTCEAFNTFMQNRRSSVTSWQKDDNGEWKPVTRVRLHAPYWLKSPDRRTYNGLEFVPDPGAPPETPGYFNLWRGFSVTRDPEPPTPRQRGPADRSAKYFKFYDHLCGAICGGDDVLFNWLWHWFAHLIQRPRERIGTAVVLPAVTWASAKRSSAT